MCFPESFVFFYGQVEALADHGGGVKCSIEVGGNDFDDVFVGEEVCRRCCLFESDRAELGVEVALHPAGSVVVGLAVAQHDEAAGHNGVIAPLWARDLPGECRPEILPCVRLLHWTSRRAAPWFLGRARR